MKILITGGAGFIASHIADAYIRLGHSVVILDNLSSGKKEFINPKAVFYKADICDTTLINRIIKKEQPEVINHHAAQISVRNSVSDPINDAKVNILGILNILEAGRVNGLRKVVFASSGGVVYGDAKIIPTPEKHTSLDPISPYGVSKLTSEKYLYFYNKLYGIKYIALRYSNVYGPRQNPHGEAGVVAIFSRNLLKGISPTINGNGRQTRDYVFVGDIVKANIRALRKDVNGCFNIGTCKETNVMQIFEGIQKSVNTFVSAVYGPAKQGEQERSCLDNRLAQKVLGWKPEVLLNNGLFMTVQYFQKND
jgi:UDP-glucose 4-epimerase